MVITAPRLRDDFLAVATAGGHRKTDKPNLPVPGQGITRALRIVPEPQPVPHDAAPAATSVPDVSGRRTSGPLIVLAYGFAALGVGINVWNAVGGDIADMALPAAMGVLAEGVVFFLPARLVALPAARKTLGIVLLMFMSAFALTNSLRMASIISADTAAARADRQTAGIRAADAALDAARKARDEACGRGQGKTVACKTRLEDVVRLETERAAARSHVAAESRPEGSDFAKLVSWLSRGSVQPGPRDFDMLWLMFRTFLPQIGGLVLMLARK